MDAAAASGGGPDAAAAGPTSAVPGAAAAAEPGPSTGGQLSPGLTEDEAAEVARWNSAKCGTLALEAEALTCFLVTQLDAKTEKAAIMARVVMVSGCSRAASAAVECMSRLGALGPQACRTIDQGLCLAERILASMAHADPSPRVVEQVLALWVQEAELALPLDERTGAAQGADTHDFPPAAAVGGAGMIFAEQPALEGQVFSADMRASLSSEPLEARRMFHAAMAATLEQVRARPSDVDIWDALALHACLAAASQADEAQGVRGEMFNVVGNDKRRAAIDAAYDAHFKTQDAWNFAAARVRAARAARAGGALPEGLASTAGGDAQPEEVFNDSSEDGDLAYMAKTVCHRNEETELDEMDHELGYKLDGTPVADLTDIRNTCACVPCQRHCCPWGPA